MFGKVFQCDIKVKKVFEHFVIWVVCFENKKQKGEEKSFNNQSQYLSIN
jgi:hypothetical protein